GLLVIAAVMEQKWNKCYAGLSKASVRPDGLEGETVAEDQLVERKLAAIFAADVADYSRLMGRDDVGTWRTLQAYRTILDRLITAHRGRIFNTAGDSVVADFASAVDAVECAVAVQKALAAENAH